MAKQTFGQRCRYCGGKLTEYDVVTKHPKEPKGMAVCVRCGCNQIVTLDLNFKLEEV